MNDQEIILLIREGKHSKVLDRLYQNFPQVRKLVLSKGGDEDDAKDVFQEGLIILCEKAADPEFKLTCAAGTYLYSVCRFLWKDRLRKKNKTVSWANNDNIADFGENHVQRHLEDEAKYSVIDKVLQDLGEKCMQLLRMYYYQKSSMKAIAEKLGYSSDKTAKNQKYKCLERAKKMAKTHSIEPASSIDELQNLQA